MVASAHRNHHRHHRHHHHHHHQHQRHHRRVPARDEERTAGGFLPSGRSQSSGPLVAVPSLPAPAPRTTLADRQKTCAPACQSLSTTMLIHLSTPRAKRGVLVEWPLLHWQQLVREAAASAVNVWTRSGRQSDHQSGQVSRRSRFATVSQRFEKRNGAVGVRSRAATTKLQRALSHKRVVVGFLAGRPGLHTVRPPTGERDQQFRLSTQW